MMKTFRQAVVDPFFKGWRETPGPVEAIGKPFMKGLTGVPHAKDIWDSTIGALIKGFRETKLPPWVKKNKS